MEFAAIWSAKLILVSVAVTAALALGSYLAGTRRRLNLLMRLIGCIIPLVIIAGSAVMCVRGYVLDDDTLRVKRLFWDTPIALNQINSAEHDPGATQQLTRTWGNGGVYAYVGDFRSAALDSFKAYVTNWDNAVVLRLNEGTVVISPSDPAAFVEAINAALANRWF